MSSGATQFQWLPIGVCVQHDPKAVPPSEICQYAGGARIGITKRRLKSALQQAYAERCRPQIVH
jgi:hypothetical protein